MVSRQVLQRLWAGALVLLFGTFSLWYGGSGQPIGPAEGRALLERVRASSAATEQPGVVAAIAGLIAHDDGREFYMINLEQLKTGPDAVKQDRAYARAVLPALLKHGSMPVYVGHVRGLLLGRDPTDFARVALVRYRSLRDFLVIFTDPAMQSGVDNKFSSMAYTEARPTSPVISLLAIQLIMALLLALVGVLGWTRIGNRAP